MAHLLSHFFPLSPLFTLSCTSLCLLLLISTTTLPLPLSHLSLLLSTLEIENSCNSAFTLCRGDRKAEL